MALLDRRRLELISPNAILVNVGRGAVIDEDSLVELLEGGHFRACILDVTEHEPLPVEHPLWSAPRCVLTQHTAGGWEGEDDAKFEFFLTNLRRYLAGDQLLNECATAD